MLADLEDLPSFDGGNVRVGSIVTKTRYRPARLELGKSGLKTSESRHSRENVCSWGYSGSQFGTPRLLLLAETVEEVGCQVAREFVYFILQGRSGTRGNFNGSTSRQE